MGLPMDHMPTRGIPCVQPVEECHWLPFLGLGIMPNTLCNPPATPSLILLPLEQTSLFLGHFVCPLPTPSAQLPLEPAPEAPDPPAHDTWCACTPVWLPRLNFMGHSNLYGYYLN